MTEIKSVDAAAIPAPHRKFKELQRWKKVLIVVAAALIVAGIVIFPFESGAREDLSTSQQTGAGNLQPAGAGESGQVLGQEEQKPDVSPAFLKLGFSFFAAFAAGLAIRSFLRIAMIFVGVLILALMGMSHLEWVTVNWNAISGAFDQFTTKVQNETGSFQTFITGSLPQAGLAAMGLFAGLKR